MMMLMMSLAGGRSSNAVVACGEGERGEIALKLRHHHQYEGEITAKEVKDGSVKHIGSRLGGKAEKQKHKKKGELTVTVIGYRGRGNKKAMMKRHEKELLPYHTLSLSYPVRSPTWYLVYCNVRSTSILIVSRTPR